MMRAEKDSTPDLRGQGRLPGGSGLKAVAAKRVRIGQAVQGGQLENRKGIVLVKRKQRESEK